MYANREYIKKCVPRLGGQLPTSFSTYKLPRTNPSLGAVIHVDALEPHESPALTQELLMKVLWTGPKSHGTARVLIDTGCRVALLFRRGLVETLMPAAKPLRFTTASGADLSGGEKGAILSLDLTISGARGPCFARVSKIFGYEADISGPDMIIGYPLLAQFGLLVDAGASCLSLNPGASLSAFLRQNWAGAPKTEVSRVEVLPGVAESQVPESSAAYEWRTAAPARLAPPAQILRQFQTLPPPAKTFAFPPQLIAAPSSHFLSQRIHAKCGAEPSSTRASTGPGRWASYHTCPPGTVGFSPLSPLSTLLSPSSLSIISLYGP